MLLLELRDQGEYGFDLPPEQIEPGGEETWAMAKHLMDYVIGEKKIVKFGTSKEDCTFRWGVFRW